MILSSQLILVSYQLILKLYNIPYFFNKVLLHLNINNIENELWNRIEEVKKISGSLFSFE